MAFVKEWEIAEGAMSTEKQKLGEYGEKLVIGTCACPNCKRQGSLKRLPPNFKCADLICDFCGFLAQVKATNQVKVDKLPTKILGAAWQVQKDRMDQGIYFSLFVVVVHPIHKQRAIFYLPANKQRPNLFVPRKPLSETARRAGWQGFIYDLRDYGKEFERLL